MSYPYLKRLPVDNLALSYPFESNTIKGMKPSQKDLPLVLKSWELGEKDVLVIRSVRCNKAYCQSCPHSWYAYARKTDRLGRPHDVYLGVSDERGYPRLPYRLLKLKIVPEKRHLLGKLA